MIEDIYLNNSTIVVSNKRVIADNKEFSLKELHSADLWIHMTDDSKPVGCLILSIILSLMLFFTKPKLDTFFACFFLIVIGFIVYFFHKKFMTKQHLGIMLHKIGSHEIVCIERVDKNSYENTKTKLNRIINVINNAIQQNQK